MNSIVVIIVVVSSANPFNCLLLFHCREETGVECLTADVFSPLSVNFVVIIKVYIFIDGDMYKQEPFAFAWIGFCNFSVFLSKPFNLVRSNAIVSLNVHTSFLSRVQKPHSKNHLFPF
jgi:hypothetical protein